MADTSARASRAEAAAPPRSISLRRRAILLVLLVSLPLFGERVYSLYGEREIHIDQTGNRLRHIAEDVALAQRETIGVAGAITQVLSREAELLLDDPAGCDRLLDRFATELTGLLGLMIADAQGIVRCASRRDLIGFNAAGVAHIATALKGPGPVLSDFLISERTGRSILVSAEAARDASGAVKAVAAVALDLDWMSRIAAYAGATAGVGVVVADAKGVVLAAYPRDIAAAGKLIQESVTLQQARGDSGTLNATAGDGEERIYGFARVPGTTVRVIVWVSESEALADLNRRIITTIGILLAALGALVVFTIIAAERLIAAPVVRLAEDLLSTDLLSAEAEVARARQPPRDPQIEEFQPVVKAYEEMRSRLGAQTSSLRSLNSRLAALASTDGLTGLFNRRSFDVQLSEEWVRCGDAGQPLSVVMADVDHFKLYNDTRGHLAGDDALRHVARIFAVTVADTNFLAARYGGEEFIVLMPNTDMTSAIEYAESVRRLIAGLDLPHPRAATGRVTASLGVASLVPEAGGSPDALLTQADAALYEAKRLGRNRVVGAHGRVGSSPLAPAGTEPSDRQGAGMERGPDAAP